MNTKNIRFVLLLFFPGYVISAQDVEDKSITEQIWLDYNPSYFLSERLDVYGDIGGRTVFPNEWYRFVVGPSVRYRRPKFILKKLYYKEELHFGIKFFFTANRDNPFSGIQVKLAQQTKDHVTALCSIRGTFRYRNI